MLQLIFYVVLPLTVGVAGVVYAEIFRARAKATIPAQEPKDWRYEVYLRHGHIALRKLREVYGSNFAAEHPDYFTLGDILRRPDAETLDVLKRDYASGRLDEIAHAE